MGWHKWTHGLEVRVGSLDSNPSNTNEYLEFSPDSRSPTFQCPQQLKTKLPLSRLNDGICDCCDGSDEPESICEDICDKVLATERAARAKAEKDYEIGSAKRKEHLAAFEVLVKETLVEIEKAEQELQAKEAELEVVATQADDAKLAYVETRRGELIKIARTLARVSDQDEQGLSGLLEPLTNEEIVLLIQLTCQVSGEMAGSLKEKTCVPLRLAGVDLGIIWTDEAFKNASVDLINSDDDAGRRLLADLVSRNQKGAKMWSEKQVNNDARNPGRRRLDDYVSDDDYHEAYDNDEFESEGYGDESEGYDQDEAYQQEKIATYGEEGGADGVQGEEIDKVKAIVEGTLFSRHRTKFLARADSLVAKIEEFVKAQDASVEQEQADDDAGGEQREIAAKDTRDKGSDNELSNDNSADSKQPPVDPIAYNMAKSTLKSRSQAIRRGLQYAVSGFILVESIRRNSDADKAREDLINLAAATLMHSRVSAEHVWRILSTILPEFTSTYNDDSQTCASTLSSICPTNAISRRGRQYPPAAIIKAGEAACERAVDEISAAGCGVDAIEEVVTHIPNGYYGYIEVQPRNGDDPFHNLFLPLYNIFPTLVTELENRQQSIEYEKTSLENDLKLLDAKIGGRDSHDTTKGELHALKDSCHLVTEGKYDYEVCIFGKASQKDKGVASGTSLGSWVGMTIDEESGYRVMKWTNGQQCWNGPQRSATVFVTCGSETKLLSAEEPDTCSYVLQMESYIACDEAHYENHLA